MCLKIKRIHFSAFSSIKMYLSNSLNKKKLNFSVNYIKENLLFLNFYKLRLSFSEQANIRNLII